MGQKVKGYRRNTEYGTRTNKQPSDKESRKGWEYKVNPKGRVGWNIGTSGRKEKGYGSERRRGKKRRTEVEEVRRTEGMWTNGRGRKGGMDKGYVVYGEYYTREKGNTRNVNERALGKERSRRKRERRRRKRETNRGVNVKRERTELNSRRKEEGLDKEKKDREKRLEKGKRKRRSERCGVVALSGRKNMSSRRAKRRARERERGRNHIERRRNRERRRTEHGTKSENGRKRLGAEGDVGKGEKGVEKKGYYGYKVTVKGRLEGSRRSMKYERRKGKIPRGTKRARIRTGEEVAKTTVGTLGVRVEYCYGLG
jgi:hypothetical protein